MDAVPCSCSAVQIQLESIQFCLCSTKSQHQSPQGALHCTVKTLQYQQALGDSGKKKLHLNRKTPLESFILNLSLQDCVI